jgi:transcriptional regulator with XRE-family HTH domain
MTKIPLSAKVKKELGLRVRVLRKKRGLNQMELADRCGIHWTYIGGVERGERNPTLSTMRRLAEGLNVDLPPLLGHLDKGENPVLTKRDKQQQLLLKWLLKGSDPAVALAARLVRAIVQEEKKRR